MSGLRPGRGGMTQTITTTSTTTPSEQNEEAGTTAVGGSGGSNMGGSGVFGGSGGVGNGVFGGSSGSTTPSSTTSSTPGIPSDTSTEDIVGASVGALALLMVLVFFYFFKIKYSDKKRFRVASSVMAKSEVANNDDVDQETGADDEDVRSSSEYSRGALLDREGSNFGLLQSPQDRYTEEQMIRKVREALKSPQSYKSRRKPIPSSDAKPGLRVMRGPGWRYGDQDGGDGKFGTLVAHLRDDWWMVQWDAAQRKSHPVKVKNPPAQLKNGPKLEWTTRAYRLKDLSLEMDKQRETVESHVK